MSMGLSKSDRIAEALRGDPPRLDDITRARIEKSLLEATRSAAAVSEPAAVRGPRRPWMLAGGGAVLVAAGVLIAVTVGSEGEGTESLAASMHLLRDGETVERGPLAEGDEVSTARGERVQVTLGGSRVDVTPESEARFVRISPQDVRIRLSHGAVEIEFHPEHRGEQTMTVETVAARVEVVGTVFRVVVDDARATTVSVQEGTVRVVPTAGSAPRLVRAGSQTRVPVAVAVRLHADPAVAAEGSQLGISDEVASAHSALSATGAGAGEAAESAAELGAPVETEAATETQPPVDEAGEPLSMDARFDLAETLQRRGRREQSRHILYGIARAPVSRADRVRAWTLIAESYEGAGEYVPASDAYRRAADTGGASAAGLNALFALAMLRDRRIGDRAAAVATYTRYLQEAPDGAHAIECRRALCRLGSRDHCE